MQSAIRTRVPSGALRALTALCLLTGTGLWAQVANQNSAATSAPASNATPAPTTAQVTAAADAAPAPNLVMMDPFSVSSETEGYQAVDTLGGARVATKLKDTPSALSVITPALLADTGITNATDLYVYTTNTEVAGLNGNFSGVASRGVGVSNNAEAGRLANPAGTNRARGLTAMDSTRNYFVSDIPWDSFDISRIDISRGPNSFLFGVGSPSGIANYSTNEAIFKDQGNVEVRTGSYGTTRQSLDYNKMLIPGQLALRVDLLNDDTQYRQKPAFNHQQRAYAALRFDPAAFATSSSHMKINVNAEAGRVSSNNPRELPPLDFITGYFQGGLNKGGYDPFVLNTNQQLTGVGSFTGVSAWVNAQDIHYLWPGPNASYIYDGATGTLLGARTTFNGANDVNGSSLSSFPQAAPLYTTGFANYARTVNFRTLVNGADTTASKFNGAYAGTVTYGDKSLTNSSIFNFYDNLIDGPNKQEWQNWHAFNATVEESLLGGRLAVQGVVDHQDYTQGQATIFGYTEPFISVDLDSNLIEYPSWSGLAVANPNAGRPFIAGDFSNGDNSTHTIRDNYQLTVNGELRADDFLSKGLLSEILGVHSITGLLGEYRTKIDYRAWDGAATDVAFGNAMGDATGNISGFRGIDWVSYLGGSLVNTPGAAGLNLTRIANGIQPVSGSVLSFNNTYTATGVNPSAPWTDPSPYATNPSTQAENPANYRGWTSITANVLNWHDNLSQLYTNGNQTEQNLRSGAFMYQGHMWDDVIVPEFGWRRDEIDQSSANAPLDPNTHVATMNYGITGSPASVTTTSTSWGVSLHLPKDIQRKLPLQSDVSVYYFHGNNQTPKVRYAFDSTQLPNESGKTDDYGVQLDTLNGHATIRLTFFKTLDQNAAAGSGAADPLGGNGYYLYLLPAWGAGDAGLDGLGLAGSTADGGFSQNTGDVKAEAAAVADWKANFAKYFPQKFFDSYGLGVNVAAVSAGNWANVYNNPNTVNYPWTIANTGGGRINGSFPIITQDIESKGFEVEATVRPVSNWDLTFNASKVNASQTALGAQDSAFIQTEYKFFSGPAGQLPLWGYWGGAGGGTSTLGSYFLQNIWSAYQLQQAQTGTEQPELSEWNFKAITNYNFRTGWAKGFNVGGGYRWQSRPILGYGISQVTDPASGTQSWIMDVHKPLYGKTDFHFDAWVGYQHRLTSKLDWRVQLNLKNVAESPHLTPVSVEPDGSWAQERIEEGQLWELSYKIMF